MPLPSPVQPLPKKKPVAKPTEPETKKGVKFPQSEVATQTSGKLQPGDPSKKGKGRAVSERDATPYPSNSASEESSDMSFLTLGSTALDNMSSRVLASEGSDAASSSGLSSDSSQPGDGFDTSSCGTSGEGDCSYYSSSVISSNEGASTSQGDSIDQIHSETRDLQHDMNVAMLMQHSEALDARLVVEHRLVAEAKE